MNNWKRNLPALAPLLSFASSLSFFLISPPASRGGYNSVILPATLKASTLLNSLLFVRPYQHLILCTYPTGTVLVQRKLNSYAKPSNSMEAELIPYPHTELSFEVRHLLPGFLTEPFDVIIEDLRFEVLGHRSVRIEELHREILYRQFHREWQSACNIWVFYDGWVREHYAHFFSSERLSEGENDHSDLVSSDDVAASQSASVHRTSNTTTRTSPTTHPNTLSMFGVRRAIRTSLITIFDIRIEHLRSVIAEGQESRIERIYRAIRDNEPHHHWNSVTQMYRAYEGCLRAQCPHLFSSGRVAADKSGFLSAAHSSASTIEAMTRDDTTTQSLGDARDDDIARHSAGQPSADLRNEDPDVSLSSNAGSFGNGNDGTPVAPIDAIGPHPESYSWGDEVHWRTAGDEERDHVLRRNRWIANGPERLTPEARNCRLLSHIIVLMMTILDGWRTIDSDTSIPQEEGNPSNAPLGISQVDSSMSSNSLIRPEGDSRTSGPGEEGGEREGQGGRDGHPQVSEPWIHNFAVSHPNIRASVPFRPPTSFSTERRMFRQRRRRMHQTPPDAPARPSEWMPNVDTGLRRRDEESRFVGDIGKASSIRLRRRSVVSEFAVAIC